MFFHQSPLALAASLFALTATAQQEQWLEYHTSTSPRGYRLLELTTNAPANVALPKLREGALYGFWTNGMETAGGRWFCLDRPRKNSPCDRIFFDRNGDGRLDDESPVTPRQREDSMAYFDSIKVVFKGEDGPISYHLIARFYQYEDQRTQFLLGSGGWYEGTVTIAGKKRRVQLTDNNANGTFNDQGTNPAECDRLMFTGGTSLLTGEASLDRYLGRYIELDGQLFRIEVARDGAFLKVEKAEGVARGTVRVPETVSEFVAVGETGHFIRKPAKGELTLPVGKYRVNGWTLNRKDARGDSWKLTGYSFPKAAEFEVTADSPPTLPIGEPVSTDLKATESKGQLAFSLKLLGPLGESVEILRGSERPRAPQLQLASADGQFKTTLTFEYG
jgi:hypothetical protein